MIVGISIFAFITGSFSSILANFDQTNAQLNERLSLLNRLY